MRDNIRYVFGGASPPQPGVDLQDFYKDLTEFLSSIANSKHYFFQIFLEKSDIVTRLYDKMIELIQETCFLKIIDVKVKILDLQDETITDLLTVDSKSDKLIVTINIKTDHFENGTHNLIDFILIFEEQYKKTLKNKYPISKELYVIFSISILIMPHLLINLESDLESEISKSLEDN